MKKYAKRIVSIILGLLLFLNNSDILNAASASISVSSSTSKVVIGNTFTVTVKISSGTTLGSWEWTIDYDKSKFKLTSGEINVADYGNGSKKSASYTYKFKAIGSGSGKISVKSYGAYSWDETKLSISASSKTINVITQAQLEASYSKNNNLKSLDISGITLSPTFDKNVTEYKAQANANTESVKVNATKEDSKASISGTGDIKVIEGDNKINVVVTAENGSSKTYSILLTVIDDNPIIVNVNNEELTVVKRASVLTPIENFESKEITINDTKIPAFYSEINDYYLVGLKDKEANINMYIYDEKNNTYSLYSETKLNQLLLQPLKIDKEYNNYIKGTTEINNTIFDSYILPNNNYSIIHARELTTGEDNYYLYDKETNTVVIYDDTELIKYKEKSDKYYKIILLLLGETALVFIILISILINNSIKKRRKRKKQKNEIVEENKDNKTKKSNKEKKNTK